MSLLLDTHAFLWFAENNPRSSVVARGAIEDASRKTAVSCASVWEIAIKSASGKLKLPVPLLDLVERARVRAQIDFLAIGISDAAAVQRLPHHHGDPFDRMIISQAIERDWTVVTADAQFAQYSVKTLW